MTSENLFQIDDVVDPAKDYLPELVGEGKKFKDASALARGKTESDLFIKKLQGELSELREHLGKQKSIEEFMTEFKKANPPADPEPSGKAGETPKTPEDLESVVEALLSKKAEALQIAENTKTVREALAARFGADAPLIVEAKAKELNMSIKDMEVLAQKNPKVFITLIGADKPLEKPAPSVFANSSVTSHPSNKSERNQKFYEDLKKSEPKKYFSSVVQLQMMKDALALKDRFYST